MALYLSQKLEKAKLEAERRYENALLGLEAAKNSPQLLPMAAQKVNDTWIELKKARLEAENYSTMKTMTELYGC